MSTENPASNLPQSAPRGYRTAINQLIPKIYDELHAIAARLAYGERAGHSLQATALVNEAYVRLIDQRNADPSDRTHFFATAANVIRRILVDHARGRDAAKRGGAWHRVTLADADRPDDQPPIDLLDLSEALDRLAALSPRAAKVVELRYFGGLTVDEAAAALELSPRTVADEWAFARAWLTRELADEDESPSSTST